MTVRRLLEAPRAPMEMTPPSFENTAAAPCVPPSRLTAAIPADFTYWMIFAPPNNPALRIPAGFEKVMAFGLPSDAVLRIPAGFEKTSSRDPPTRETARIPAAFEIESSLVPPSVPVPVTPPTLAAVKEKVRVSDQGPYLLNFTLAPSEETDLIPPVLLAGAEVITDPPVREPPVIPAVFVIVAAKGISTSIQLTRFRRAFTVGTAPPIRDALKIPAVFTAVTSFEPPESEIPTSPPTRAIRLIPDPPRIAGEPVPPFLVKTCDLLPPVAETPRMPPPFTCCTLRDAPTEETDEIPPAFVTTRTPTPEPPAVPVERTPPDLLKTTVFDPPTTAGDLGPPTTVGVAWNGISTSSHETRDRLPAVPIRPAPENPPVFEIVAVVSG